MNKQVYIRELAGSAEINAAIIEQFNRHRESEAVRRSHLFAGRYENLYLDISMVPAMQLVADQAKQFVQQILASNAELKFGFWFNLMQPGHVTQPHTHDDSDECLSGVYYIDTPENCGDLLVTTEDGVVRVSPKAGQFVFFSPTAVHEVTKNLSDQERLSVGMNFGFKDQ